MRLHQNLSVVWIRLVNTNPFQLLIITGAHLRVALVKVRLIVSVQ